MTPPLAFAIVVAISSALSFYNPVAAQDISNGFDTFRNQASSTESIRDANLKVGPDGALPVIELAASQWPETIDLTAEPEELFQRIRQGFAMPNLNNSLVLHHQQYYQNRPDSLRRMVERSSRYLHHIVEELGKRGMPMELALLPMVESAYNPTAYSRSRASGLWQFVPATGKQYKLEQNAWVDERRDIVASTAAALDYLQYIYELHGDWHLALASYNWGEGAVGRAINKNRAQGLPTDYQNLSMPEETRNYVPKLQALKNIFSNPRVLAQLNIRGVPNRPYFATITRPSNIDVKLAAQLAGMSVQEFTALNPSHNRPVIKSDTPMVLPADKVDTFLKNIAAHQENDKPLSSWQSHTLRAGERLEQVAQRYGMSLSELKAVNKLKNRDKVEPGLALLVAAQQGASSPEDLAIAAEPPATGAMAAENAAEKKIRLARSSTSAAAPVNVDTAPAITEKIVRPVRPATPIAAPAHAESATFAAAPRTHTVAKGETLLKVAKRYGLTLSEIRQINRLRADTVAVGKKLTVVADERAAPASRAVVVAEAERKTAASPQREAANETPSHSPIQTHTVQKGETLHKIAQRYGLSLAQIREMNRLRADKVTVGSKLAVAPNESGGKPATKRELLADNESKAPAARHETATSTQTHVVRKGETVATIAHRYGMTVAELKQINKLRGGQIIPGGRLAVRETDETDKSAFSKSRTKLASLDAKPDKADDAREKVAGKAKRGKNGRDDEVVSSKGKDKKHPKLAQYTIRRGDTLVSIAKHFRVEKDDLLRWNRLPANAIKPGQTLTIQLVQNTL
ncbi:MAG: LysM peptidoglycan-binding domain-containing protein [Candidatus Accumulibacter sp.]|nr:LysM peptidoglycan-binding domain-containing protein [Accumulibacter sp.]